MRRRREFCWAWLALASTTLALTASGAAFAAQPDRAQVLKNLVDCRAVADNAARLACYDKAAGEIDKAEAGGDIVVVDRKQAQAARRQAFGLSLSALSIFDRAATREELNVIEAKVASSSHGPDGRWVIVLDDGATWREIGDMEPNLEPTPGAAARISRGITGSYFIKIKGVSTRVHRSE